MQKTHAHRKLVDDVPEEVKQRRLVRMAEAFREGAAKLNQNLIGTDQLVLVEGVSNDGGQAIKYGCRQPFVNS